MSSNRKTFLFIALPLVVVLIALAVYLMRPGRQRGDNPLSNLSQAFQSSGVPSGNGPNYRALAACDGKPIFTTVPTTLSDFDQIVPLGNIGVPDHTVPTDHLYFAFKHIGDTTTNPTLVSPGKVVVISIEYSGEKINGVDSRASDYNLTFTGCKGMSFNFGHVQTLTGELANAVADQKWDKACETHHPAANEETFYCTKSTDIALQPGDTIGKVGGRPDLGAFDFGAHDAHTTDAGFINAKWYPTINAVCGLNYFDAASKAQLMSIVKRTAEPVCGQIGQDKAGTAQGTWFALSDPQSAFSNWNSNLSLVHNNIDPTIGVLAVGGTITDPMIFTFKPQSTGQINREFSQVTSSGGVFCYQNEETGVSNNKPGSGHVNVKLIDNTHLQIEHKDGSCSPTETLTKPTTYYR